MFERIYVFAGPLRTHCDAVREVLRAPSMLACPDILHAGNAGIDVDLLPFANARDEDLDLYLSRTRKKRGQVTRAAKDLRDQLAQLAAASSGKTLILVSERWAHLPRGRGRSLKRFLAKLSRHQASFLAHVPPPIDWLSARYADAAIGGGETQAEAVLGQADAIASRLDGLADAFGHANLSLVFATSKRHPAAKLLKRLAGRRPELEATRQDVLRAHPVRPVSDIAARLALAAHRAGHKPRDIVKMALSLDGPAFALSSALASTDVQAKMLVHYADVQGAGQIAPVERAARDLDEGAILAMAKRLNALSLDVRRARGVDQEAHQ